MATGKSDVQGGHRSATRHASEIGVGGALALLIVSYLPEGVADAFQSNMLSVVLTGAFSTVAKMAGGGTATALIKKVLKLGLVAGLMGTMGCAMSIGQVTPEEFTGANGETIIACDLKGIQFGVFDGGVCRNVEGGQVGETFVDLFTGAVEAVGRILGGILTGFASAGSALGAPQAAVPAAAPEQPAAPAVGEFFE